MRDFQLPPIFQDNFTPLKPLKIWIKSRLSKSPHYTCTSWHNQQQENDTGSTLTATLHWLNLMSWYYQYTKTLQLQILNYYNYNILKSMHYTYTTWNFQAIIFLSLRNNYTAYNQQPTTFQHSNIPTTSLHLRNL